MEDNNLITKLDFNLNKHLKATITLTKEGLQDPSQGNQISVLARLDLPAYKLRGMIRIHPINKDLQFGLRCESVFGQSLNSNWGDASPSADADSYYSCKTKYFYGETYTSVIKEAFDYSRAEVKKIQDALFTRQLAIDKADNNCVLPDFNVDADIKFPIDFLLKSKAFTDRDSNYNPDKGDVLGADNTIHHPTSNTLLKASENSTFADHLYNSIAQAWDTPENKHKNLDSDLANTILKNLLKYFDLSQNI